MFEYASAGMIIFITELLFYGVLVLDHKEKIINDTIIIVALAIPLVFLIIALIKSPLFLYLF